MDKISDMGKTYIPLEERTGRRPPVFFTRDLSEKGLEKILKRIRYVLNGKIAIKVQTGGPHNPPPIPPSWVKYLMAADLPQATIVTTDPYCESEGYSDRKGREARRIQGWTFSPVEIMDSEGAAALPLKGGKWFSEMSVGKSLLNYNSMLVLTNFKYPSTGGFRGANQSVGLDCADRKIGHALIHTAPDADESSETTGPELIEKITESAKAAADFFRGHIGYINVMKNHPASCPSEGPNTATPTPDSGILGSLDILAIDQACIDLIWNRSPNERSSLIENLDRHHGLRQLSYMKELGMGHDSYELIDIDHEDDILTPPLAAQG